MINFHYQTDLYSIIFSRKYKYISECIDSLYNKDKSSVREIAKIMNVSSQTVLFWMQKWKFHRRSRGGNTKSDFLRTPDITKKIMNLKGKMSMRAAAKIIGCCPTTIRNTWISNSKD